MSYFVSTRELLISQETLHASDKGGGVHAISSFVTVFANLDEPFSLHFINDMALLGGGIYLESTARISVERSILSLICDRT